MARIPLVDPPRTLLPTDTLWPVSLADLNDPPAELRVAGSLPDLSRAVAIVGTRFADDDALAFTRALAADLAAAGEVVVSGGAAGIDAAAHEGALSGGGQTIAVLATGLEHAYPARHAPLFGRIARSGALLSEWTGGAAPSSGWLFLRRNRLVAALAPVVVIVQAPARSGALSTARWAKRLKRRVLVVPAAPWDARGTGCLELLLAGAEICTSVEDILSLAPLDGPVRGRRGRRGSRKKSRDDERLPVQSRRVYGWLRGRRAHPDEISAALDMPAAEVQEALLTLMLSGMCQQRADGAYEKTASAKSSVET
jgi:DNA processing protein